MKYSNQKGASNGFQALFNELETRFGTKTAHDIVNAIYQAAENSKTPDFMAVKACSEAVELFRGEAQEVLQRLKTGRGRWIEDNSNISSLEKRKLEMEFKRIYRLYWVSMKLFYPLYNRALSGYRAKGVFSYPRPSETTGMAKAA